MESVRAGQAGIRGGVRRIGGAVAMGGVGMGMRVAVA
jgi:hypothetical protein